MRKLIGVAFLLMSSVAMLVPTSGAMAAADQTVADFEVVQQAAWNAHDATAYAAAFDQNVDVITSLGWHWTSQAEAAQNLGDGFRLIYAGARLQVTNVKVRMLTPELASVVLDWSIDGARTIEGNPQAGEQRGIETQLLQRRGAGWLILSQQDTMSASAPSPVSPASKKTITASEPPAVSKFPTTPPPVRRCVLARANGECVIYGKAKPAPAN